MNLRLASGGGAAVTVVLIFKSCAFAYGLFTMFCQPPAVLRRGLGLAQDFPLMLPFIGA
jgi:hypothetical protein